jgi:hypothetical protein
MTDDITDRALRDRLDPLISDDALLDDPAAHAGRDELATLLAGWRAEIDAVPHPALLDVAANQEASQPSPWLAILIAVLLVLAGALGGVLGIWIALR